MKKYTTIIFDLDGTLLNTLEDLTDSTNYALQQYGLPARTLEEVRQFVGNGIMKLIQRAVPVGTEEKVTDEVFSCFKAYYTAHCSRKTAPYPGIVQMLRELQTKGYRLAIVSNKAHEAVRELAVQYFPEMMDAVMGEQEAAGIHKKPAPDMVNAVMHQLHSNREETLYIGDSEVDKATADHAGLDCLLVTWGFREKERLAALQPTGMADSAAEVLAFIEAEANIL